MKKLGIIGAENSHTAAIARELNVDKLIKGFRVTHVWGETRKFAQAAAEAGQIPCIVKDPSDMLGEVDCVMVDHRNGKHHVKAVMPFLNAGIPIFVDKPFTTSLAEARRFLQARREKGVPVTTMSAIPHQACVKELKKRLKTLGQVKVVHLNGPGDPKSKYGGIFFYGIHQVDLMVELFGTAPTHAAATADTSGFTAVISYPKGPTVTIGMPGVGRFSVTAVGTEGGFHEPIVTDANVYLATSKMFTRMFRTGKEPCSDARMLAPIAVLEAMQKSLDKGRRVRIAQVG